MENIFNPCATLVYERRVRARVRATLVYERRVRVTLVYERTVHVVLCM